MFVALVLVFLFLFFYFFSLFCVISCMHEDVEQM